MTYSLTAGTSIKRDADGAFIPPDSANADYQKYQAWVAAGNTPTPYTPPPPDYKSMALVALAKSDEVLMRCFEHGLPVPLEWTNYRMALRAILKSPGPLPTQPSYPLGT